MIKWRRRWVILGLLGLLYSLAIRCTSDQLRPIAEGKYSIQLRWVPAYEGERRDQVLTGLQWSLSFLGAHLPAANWPAAVQFIDDHRFVLHLGEVGFSASSLEAMAEILARLKVSEEYRKLEAIDLARFLVLSLHSSWHYYAITDAPGSLTEYLAQKTVERIDSFPILTSSIAQKNRMIRFQVADELAQTFFIAEETEDVQLPSYPIDHYEVLDILPNGQLRFLLYDEQGNLAPAAPIATTLAGKPSKCLWCHEVNVQPLFRATADVPGFLSSADFMLQVDTANQRLVNYRALLPSSINFNDKQAHTQSELLYISFMEPSLERIAAEWEMAEEEVQNILKGFPTHTYDEFPFLGALYFRQWVDSLAPYRSERVPDSVRELGWEPNFFR